MSLVKEDAREYLEEEEDQDLWSSLDWTVIEDKASLDGVDYKVARNKFDAWA